MFASKNIKKKPFEKKNDNNQFKNNYPTKRRNFHKFADSPVINGGFMLPSNQIHSENQVNMVRKYISAPESIIQLKPLKGEKTISRPGSEGEIADIVLKIRKRREKKFKKLEQLYREHLMKKAGIRHRGEIKTPQEALQILKYLSVDLAELNSRILVIQSSTTSKITGKKKDAEIEQQAKNEVAKMSKIGQGTLNKAVSAVRKERYLDFFIKTHDVNIIPDQAACGGYNGFIQTGKDEEPIPGAQTARRLKFIVFVCKDLIEKGDISKVRGIIAHELSHAIELEVTGKSGAKLITNPLINELIDQLIQLPQYKGYKGYLKQYLYEKIGSYGFHQLFAILQQIPHTEKYQRGDQVRDLVICELRHIDALKIPQDIRDFLLDELQLKTEILYDIRISFAEEPYKNELKTYKKRTLLILTEVKDLRELIELEGKDPYQIPCSY